MCPLSNLATAKSIQLDKRSEWVNIVLLTGNLKETNENVSTGNTEKQKIGLTVDASLTCEMLCLQII